MTVRPAGAALVGLALVGLVACGARTGLPGDAPTPVPPCAPLAFELQTQAACRVTPLAGATFDGEGFISTGVCTPCTLSEQCDPTPPADHRILSLARAGAGHAVVWCDSTTLAGFVNAIDVRGYLGLTEEPRVASVGSQYPCEFAEGVPGATHLGAALPAAYESDAEALAADWDVLVVCGSPGPGAAWQPTLVSYVKDLGRGILVSQDYRLSCEGELDTLLALNALGAELGFELEPVELDWGELSVDLGCVPDWPLPP